MPGMKTYFVADVHLGLRNTDPGEREARFVHFLKSIRAENTDALYLLGDIWDFWYEYRDVVPREGARVIAQLIRLVDEGVSVYFMAGNHDIWCFSFFESLGIKKIEQPHFVEIEGKRFCLGHGDGLGGAKPSYKLLSGVFHCRFLQVLFSTIHPWLAFRLGNGWSGTNRKTHSDYVFVPENEPIYSFAKELEADGKADFFVFGHYHSPADKVLPGGSRFVVLRDWISGGQPYAVFDGENLECVF